MSTRSLIENLLTDAFSPNFLEVRDVSAAHYGHAGAKEGGESHFEVDIEATAFSEKNQSTISSIDLRGIKALVRFLGTCCSFEC